MAPLELSAATTLARWIGKRAELHGERPALTFVDDEHGEETWTYADLWRRSCYVADLLSRIPQTAHQVSLERDINCDSDNAPRALLLYRPGIEFLAGFLGSQIAGWIPVPTCYPKPGRAIPRLDSAAQDCVPLAILGDRESIEGIDPSKLSSAASNIARIVTDLDEPTATNGHWIDPDSLPNDGESLAFLQYTSGSTSDPKGVMVRHRNVLANLEAIRRGFKIDWQSIDADTTECGVFWLPFFHDMGLIGGILAPLYVGGRTVLISPRSFLQRPIRWLQTISDYGATISGAPNFAYQLCVDRISPDQTDSLDLSRWRIAFSGAEPILARTLQDFGSRFSSSGFSSHAFYPCYGLAEATLLAAGGDGPAEPQVLVVSRDSLSSGKPRAIPGGRGPTNQKLVSCGTASYQTELRLVDPTSCQVVGEDTVGEIWLRGDSIADGYWNRREENEAMFKATLVNGQSGFCRTGDLGFFHDGELFVTGRLKDMIILRGRNLFPQDIEATTAEATGRDGGLCAAFSIDSGRGEALAIVAEVPRNIDDSKLPELVRSIRRSIIDIHEVDPRHVWLVRPASVPITSSGKVQRSRCREMFVGEEMKTKYRYDRSSGSEQVPIAIPVLPSSPTPNDQKTIESETESWMSEWLIARAGVDPNDVELNKPFDEYGLDSMTAVEMSGEIEDWSGVELTPIVAWNYPSVACLSEFIAQQIIGAATGDEFTSPSDDTQPAQVR